MKKIFALIACVFMALGIKAVPAYRGPRVVTQSDGTEMTVFAHGDEYFHWITDENGNLVELQDDGTFIISYPLSDTEIAQRSNSARKARARRLPTATNQAVPLNIAPRGLLVLVNFSDVAFSTEKAEMDSMINGQDYSRNYTFNYGGYSYRITSSGSARQYFIDQSMGQYQPQFDVVGPYTVSKKQSYYGSNDGNGNDQHVDEMIIEACRAADEDGVDFTQYDNNNDGVVDFVFVIYAGNGEADGGAASTIWPHFYWMRDGYGYGYYDDASAIVLDGKVLNAYACCNEINYLSKKHTGIGTFCHEFGHVLGLPDLYATNKATHRTMDDWDIMDAGSYNNNGDTPPAYSAYERFFLGWLKPTVLNTPGKYSLKDLKSSNAAYMITATGTSNLVGNNPNPTEFYLLENRQKTSWDKKTAGSGMMITKVKYSYNKWMENTVNNTASSLGVDIIEAGGADQYSSATDLFPNGATEYTPYATYPITDITTVSKEIRFLFMGGVTDIEQVSQPAGSSRKILRDGQLYILNGDRLLDMTGQPVR